MPKAVDAAAYEGAILMDQAGRLVFVSNGQATTLQLSPDELRSLAAQLQRAAAAIEAGKPVEGAAVIPIDLLSTPEGTQ